MYGVRINWLSICISLDVCFEILSGNGLFLKVSQIAEG